MEREAVDWSLVKGDSSGRIAYQFACDWVERFLLRQDNAARPSAVSGQDS